MGDSLRFGHPAIGGPLSQPNLLSGYSRRGGGRVHRARGFFFFFFTLVTGPSRSLSLKLSDTRVCEPQIRGFAPHLAPTPETLNFQPETRNPIRSAHTRPFEPEASKHQSLTFARRFRGGLVFKAGRLFVSLNSRLVSNNEEQDLPGRTLCPALAPSLSRSGLFLE